jgi:hypothetical protein
LLLFVVEDVVAVRGVAKSHAMGDDETGIDFAVPDPVEQRAESGARDIGRS